MDQMPELVASFHSLTGLAAVLVGIAGQLGNASGSPMSVAKLIETFLGVSVGAATFSGSIAAALKLHGVIPGGPIGLKSRLWINLISITGVALQLWGYMATSNPTWQILALCGNAAVSLVLGTMLVLPIGGADIPIVISVLNSLSGLATSATGFSLDNSLLVMSGALIASSGAILSDIMCKGINRSLWSVLVGGFGVGDNNAGTVVPSSSSTPQEIHSITIQELVKDLESSRRVLIIPGYGMAVARCQSGVNDIYKELSKRRIDVVFGIHPVAGRLPGHMNVILSEAGVPYDVVKEMDEVNKEMDSFDIAIVLGANDIVNPATATDPHSPIYGMPAIECWRAKKVVVMKRSMNTGYSGVDNPLFYLPNTCMLFGDAKETVDKLHLAIVDSEWVGVTMSSASSNGGVSTNHVPHIPTSIDPDLSKLPPSRRIIGILPESTGDKRIPISPKVVYKLCEIGFGVSIPSRAGQSCNWSDSIFEIHGARIVSSERQIIQDSDILIKLSPLSGDQLSVSRPPENLERNQILITAFPNVTNEQLEQLVNRQLTTFNLNLVPRISRAQSMDIMSSMANLVGYKAVINAFHRLGKLSRSSVTASGNIPASRVFVIGCGVAGLSAIATAHALGATVLATDVRPATKEQVESIGATFVAVTEETNETIRETNGGYATQVSESFAQRQKQLYKDFTSSSDIVITTAMVPGKPAPKLVSEEMVADMKPGSIIVDLAAMTGGNCDLTIPDNVITTNNGVIIDGTTNYPSQLSQLSSELISQNIFSFIENLCGKPRNVDGLLDVNQIDISDVIVRQSIVVLDGKIMYPPPELDPVVTSPATNSITTPIRIQPVPQQITNPYINDILLLAGAAGLGAIGFTADLQTVRLVGDFVLSCVIGHFTVTSVTPALHTPLISVTNAISGIIVVGGMIEMGPAMLTAKSACASAAVLASIVNVSGGFAVTDRMLSMFKSQQKT
jgi:NAD(P) transhydrogenase